MNTFPSEGARTAESNFSGALVIPLRAPHARVLITELASAWRDEVTNRLNYLCSLPEGWNGYRAGPVRFSTAEFAFRMLEAICTSTTPTPSIVPGSAGDLQIEWHLKSIDIELHVRAPNDVNAWRHRSTGDEFEDEELELSNDFTAIGGWIENLMETTSAAIGSAA